MDSNLNLPVVIKYDDEKFTVTNKTIMRKKILEHLIKLLHMKNQTQEYPERKVNQQEVTNTQICIQMKILENDTWSRF